jgi:AAA+ superfamily predicted ATPase
MVSTPWDAGWHLRAELARVQRALVQHLARQRRHGRSPAGDAVRGFVIEDGEAEGLLAELGAELSAPPPAAPASPERLRDDIAERAALGAGQGAVLPLRHAARAFELTPGEYDALLLALAVELDARWGRLIAYLNDHVGHTRPTLGLAVALAGLEPGHALSAVDLVDRPLVRDGLLEVEGEGPLPGLSLRVPRGLLPRLLGPGSRGLDDEGTRLHPPEPGRLQRLVLEESLRARLAAWAEATRQRRPTPPLVMHGAPGSGRSTAARAAAFEAGLPVVSAALTAEALADGLRVARREARWHDAVALLRVAPAPGAPGLDWRAVWAGLAGVARPVVLVVPTEAVEEAASLASAEPTVLQAAEPGPALRVGLWRALLPAGARLDGAELADLAGRFRFNPGRIARAVRRATAEVTLDSAGEGRLTVESLERACRAAGDAAMGPLAQKLPLPFERRELVVPAPVQAELDLAVAWVRHQHTVLEEWGFARRVPMGHGLTALFSGPPGTGKTMAVQILARELGLDLYRVDLSRVMSKYIGETEKNLGRLFDEAQASGAVLFFDEADALFGKRSEVRDAHDRYANVEIGYLLQRMEEHEGVTVLATNRMGDMDEAFLRRFHVVADFPLPGEADRLRIWEGMFPKDAAREPGLDLAAFARDFEVSGGEIRNTVLAAAYLAAAESRPVGMRHLRRALARELTKQGKIVDERKLRDSG